MHAEAAKQRCVPLPKGGCSRFQAFSLDTRMSAGYRLRVGLEHPHASQIAIAQNGPPWRAVSFCLAWRGTPFVGIDGGEFVRERLQNFAGARPMSLLARYASLEACVRGKCDQPASFFVGCVERYGQARRSLGVED